MKKYEEIEAYRLCVSVALDISNTEFPTPLTNRVSGWPRSGPSMHPKVREIPDLSKLL
jgi:hypothetical protein